MFLMVYYSFSKPEDVVISEESKTLAILITIPMSMIVVTMILNPIDFLKNFKHYVFGQIMMFTMFYLVFVVHFIYAYTNMHDVKWGNRPESRND